MRKQNIETLKYELQIKEESLNICLIRLQQIQDNMLDVIEMILNGADDEQLEIKCAKSEIAISVLENLKQLLKPYN